MSTRADGSIIIDTKINTEKASSQMLQLENKIVKTADRITELTKKKQKMMNAKIPTEEYQEIVAQISKAEQEFDKLLAKQEEMQNTGRDSGAAWESLQYKMEQIGNTIRYAKGELQDLEERGQAFTLGQNTVEYTGLLKNLENANREMNVLCRKHEELEEKQKKNTKEYSRMGKVAGNTSKKSGSFLKGLTSGFKGLNKHVKTGNGLFGQMGTRLKGLAMSLLIFNWISKGWNAMISGMKEGIQNLVKHSDEFNRSMSELKSSTEQAKNALATAFAPVISSLIPYIVDLINIVNTACDAFARFWAYLSGKSAYTRAKKQNEDYADSLDGIANSAKKALGTLAGFDKLNVISQNEDSKDSSGKGDNGDLFEEVPIGDVSDWLKKLKEAILAGDWYSVGELIGQKLTEAMESINWDSVYAKAAVFGVGLALFLNGLISPELFGALGKTLAGALNTAIYTALLFGEEFDWEGLGDSIATGINSFLATFDANALADTLNVWIKGALATVSTLLEKTDFYVIGNKIGEFLVTLDFTEILGDIAETIKEAIEGAFGLLVGMIEEAPLETALIAAFATFKFTKLGAYVSGKIATALAAKLGLEGTFTSVGTVFTTALKTALTGAVASMGGIGGMLTMDIGTILGAGTIAEIGAFLGTTFIGGFLAAIGGLSLGTKLYEIINGDDVNWKDTINTMKESFTDGSWKDALELWGQDIYDGLYSFALWQEENWNELWDDVERFFVNGWNGIVSWWKENGLSSWHEVNVKPWFTKEKWASLFENIKKYLIEKWNSLVSWWSKNGVSKWYNEKVKTWFIKSKWNFSEIKEGLSQAFNDAVVALKDIWNTFKEWIKDKLSFDFEFNLPEWADNSSKSSGENGGLGIPFLADGAVIRGGSPFMAVLGDQPMGQTNIETPLSTMVDAFKRAYAEVGAEMGGEYTFIAQLDGRQIFKETVRRNQMYKKQTGQSAYI